MHFISQFYKKFPSTVFHCLILGSVSLGPEDLKKPLPLNSMNMSTVLYGAEGGECLCVHVFGMNLYGIY